MKFTSRAFATGIAYKDLNNYAPHSSHDLREPLAHRFYLMSILEASLNDKLSEEEKQFFAFAVDWQQRMDEILPHLNAAKRNQSV